MNDFASLIIEKHIDFMDCCGGIDENSPGVAAALGDEGLGPEDGELAHFAARMRGVVDAVPHERRLALLRAHPELAGKLAVADGLTAESKSEQAGAGLARCTPAEFARFLLGPGWFTAGYLMLPARSSVRGHKLGISSHC